MVRGSGIGLAVADEIMKQHNGLLFLESTESVGTTVTVVLPLAPQETGDAATAEAETFAPGGEPLEEAATGGDSQEIQDTQEEQK